MYLPKNPRIYILKNPNKSNRNNFICEITYSVDIVINNQSIKSTPISTYVL